MCTLVSKYNIPGPRYTSYPPVPYWDQNSFSLKLWQNTLLKSFKKSKKVGLSLYIHLPFCEKMCTFCGCNKRITKNHTVEMPYIKSVIKEFENYVTLFGEKPTIKQIHLGGGTPTFFSPKHLQFLVEEILNSCKLASNPDFSFEAHPLNTTQAHLETLSTLGFKKVCFGVQDYNLKVQQAINRVQPFQSVLKATNMAREAGYTSVGHDIIYGLPFQTEKDVAQTISKTIKLKPDRIAFYSYAHVPWIKGNGQRGFKTEDLPSPEQKFIQQSIGRKALLDNGYKEVGIDHFALPTDTLYKAKQNQTLHRNFMGYCDYKTQILIGLGVSAISDSWYGFAQNVKNVEEYQYLVNQGIVPTFKGHILNKKELKVRQQILNLMCHLHTALDLETRAELNLRHEAIQKMENDNLIKLTEESLQITEKGKDFIRNACMLLDYKLQEKKLDKPTFSMTI